MFARHGRADTGSIYIVKRISDQRMTRQGDPLVPEVPVMPGSVGKAVQRLGRA